MDIKSVGIYRKCLSFLQGSFLSWIGEFVFVVEYLGGCLIGIRLSQAEE